MGKASELGSSLLASKQRRDDSFRKDREKWEKRQAFISLAAPALTTGLAAYAKRKDTDLLFSNPEVMEVASNFKIAGRNSATLAATEAAIALSGKSPQDYHFDLYADDFRAAATAELESRGEAQAGAIGDAGPFNKLIAAETRSLTDEMAEKYMSAITSARSIGSDEDRAALLTDLTSSINPKRISGHIIKRARGLFGRRTQEELDEAAIEALRNSTIAENVDRFNEFKEAYDNSKNIVSAFDYAGLERFSDEQLAGVQRTSGTKTEYVINTENVLMKQKITTTINPNTKQVTETLGDLVTIYDRTDSAEDKEAATLNMMMDNVDIFQQMKTFGTPEARAEFSRQAKAKDLAFMNPRTITEYLEVQTIAEDILGGNPELYLLNEFQDQTILELIRVQGTTALQIQSMIAQISDDPDEAEAAQLRVDELFKEYYEQSKRVAAMVRGDSPSRNNNVPMPAGYGSSLTQEAWDNMNATQRAQFPPR
jgi:hypothetical protein